MKSVMFLILVFVSAISSAQNDSISPLNIQPYGIVPYSIHNTVVTKIDSLKAANLLRQQEAVSYWKNVNRIGLDLSEVAFVNWNAGGSNSISGLLGVAIKRDYSKGNAQWKNELLMQYGVNKQKDQEFRKTDDNIELNSTFGYRKDSLSNFYYSAKFNFNTQFSKGYTYPNTENEISEFMAPAYLFLGVGSEYNAESENLLVYASPLTMKSTFVLDQELADSGAFGVTPAVVDENGEIIKEGENVRTQVGILLTNEYHTKVLENITLNNKLSLYTDYLNRFGNVDVNWELNFRFKVNDYVVAKLGSHLKYDDDIKIKEENSEGELVEKGPAVQWKQQLGIGVIVNL